jgi:hypothetical protein
MPIIQIMVNNMIQQAKQVIKIQTVTKYNFNYLFVLYCYVYNPNYNFNDCNTFSAT